MKCRCCGTDLPDLVPLDTLRGIVTGDTRAALINTLADQYPRTVLGEQLQRALWIEDNVPINRLQMQVSRARSEIEPYGWTITRKRDAYKLTKTKSSPVPKVLAELKLDVSPEMELRIRNMVIRGFDVPPSKAADYKTLGYAQVPMLERKRLLNLE